MKQVQGASSKISNGPKEQKIIMPRLKGFRDQFDAHVCSKAPSTATATFLLPHRVRCGIGAQKVLGTFHCTLQQL